MPAAPACRAGIVRKYDDGAVRCQLPHVRRWLHGRKVGALPLDNKGPQRVEELVLADPVLDQGDYRVRPSRRVLDGEIVAIRGQKLDHSNKASTLVSLGKSMRLGNACEQLYRERNDVFFAISKRISRARQGAFQQPQITEEMGLAGNSNDGLVDLDDCLSRQPLRFIWQVRPGSSENVR